MISTEGEKAKLYHRPVMAEETAFYLVGRRDGIFLEATCGGGGHLKYLSGILTETAVLIGLDQDRDAVAAATGNLKTVPQKTTIVNSPFSRLDEVVRNLNMDKVDGVFFDLGVSSHQIDTPARGFSFMSDGPLDMRMNSGRPRTAAEVINTYPEKRLAEIFKTYGEVRGARRFARAVATARRERPLRTTAELTAVLKMYCSRKDENATLARLYQALRLEVNGELDELREALPKALDILAPDGRLVVIAYHSLEDRIVKRFLAGKARGCICPPRVPVCTCGHQPEIEILTRKVKRPAAAEVAANSRARSARLRAARKLREGI